MGETLLEVTDLSVRYPGRRRRDESVEAVGGVSFTLGRGETLGLVGESGSGKSTIGNAILGLARPSGGSIKFRGQDITFTTARQRRALGQHLQVIFQDPYSSLNPSRTIGSTLAEPLRVIRRMRHRAAEERVIDVLGRVGMPPDSIHRYPAAFSGGQRQRIAIARALVGEPQLIICDEPTSALDLSIQAQILNLLVKLQGKFNLSYLFISHDIDVVRYMSHRAAVLFKGHIVEEGPAKRVTEHPQHDYSKALIAAVPIPDPHRQMIT